MFADDLALCAEAAAKYGPLAGPIVDVGGLENPTIADYQVTIDAMSALMSDLGIERAQLARYIQRTRPLSFLGEYIIENPESGGLPVERLHERYWFKIGTAILLSVLEHVPNPFHAVAMLRKAMAPGGLVIVSVPWMFPFHPSPQDFWRFSPDALRVLFEPHFEVLECDWRLDIPAEAGVLDIKTGRAQQIQSCYLIARSQ